MIIRKSCYDQTFTKQCILASIKEKGAVHELRKKSHKIRMFVAIMQQKQIFTQHIEFLYYITHHLCETSLFHTDRRRSLTTYLQTHSNSDSGTKFVLDEQQ